MLARAAADGRQTALSGGSTPRRAYELAGELERDWSRAGIWWGDERCVPPDDERSNFRLVREALLDRLTGAPATHRIRGELGAFAAAEEYERELARSALDVVLLGIGADGHTASLFPGSPALAERERLAAPVTGRELDRVTLTPIALSAAPEVVFLATGADKAEAVQRAFRRAPSTDTPASLIRSSAGRTVAVVDRAAAGLLSG